MNTSSDNKIRNRSSQIIELARVCSSSRSIRYTNIPMAAMSPSVPAPSSAHKTMEKINVYHVDIEDSAVQKIADRSTKFSILSTEAKLATDAEHAMTLRGAIKLYPKRYSGSFFAFPAFTKRYGVLQKDGKTYQIPGPWKAGLSNDARVAALSGFIFIPFFAHSIDVLEVGTILMGMSWGVFQTLTTSYASEVCPVALRGYLTTYVNMIWGLGQLIASGISRSLLTRNDQWAYRIPYALQWMWPVPLIIGIACAPASPWWLVRQDRNDDARKALRRLTSTESETDIDTTSSMMRYTNGIERNWFRNIILGLFQRSQSATKQKSLAALGSFSMDTDEAFNFSISLYAVAMIDVVIA
ncbi:hypothetical protein VTL71DRAFT_3500 [Oculimacula yallundae]|uniref:Major facilitator superfamily (MFS) profile domain-containing protein n=1 Tax=Oculimacula yallundae TaxID=86028 RepID=A0ABR4C7X3_9HELO